MKVLILGLSITSSWGNGHATNYRGLVKALARRGDEVTFLERDMPWYAANRDLPDPPGCSTRLYDSVPQLRERFTTALREAGLVIVGSFVPDGVEVAEWVSRNAGGALAFYDIDTPVTLEKLRAGDFEYLRPDLVRRFDVYLSFTGGPALEIQQTEFGARRPCAFYCFVDPEAYAPVEVEQRWALNYIGTYSPGRQPAVEQLLLEPARHWRHARFAVAGPMYPPEITWPANVERIEHLPPPQHPSFYCATDFTLNVTRPEMREVGYSPSVRLFEAAACGTAILSDRWPGLEEVLKPGEEIVTVASARDVLAALDQHDAPARARLGGAARERVLAEHTADRRAEQLHELLLGSAVGG